MYSNSVNLFYLKTYAAIFFNLVLLMLHEMHSHCEATEYDATFDGK